MGHHSLSLSKTMISHRIAFHWCWVYPHILFLLFIPCQLTGVSSQDEMLLKCCTHYVSIFGKLSSGHFFRTGKGQFPFQSQRGAVPNNVQTTIKLHSFHMLVRLFSKSFKLGFSSTYIENFHIYKLGLEKAEEREIELPTSIG